MRHTRLILLVIGLVMLGLSTFTVASTNQAPSIKPTPTDLNDSSNPKPTRPTSNDDDDDDGGGNAAIVPLEGGVSGFVYNYSAGARPASGLTVILDGGSWRAETQTDSEGFYQFAGLGSGEAVLNLALPSGAKQVTQNWPVHTGGTTSQVNLGFYSEASVGAAADGSAALPVILRVNPEIVTATAGQAIRLTLQVHNQSGGSATKAKIALNLPSEVTVVEAEISQGTLVYPDQQVVGALGDLANGSTATMDVQLRLGSSAGTQTLFGHVTLNYQEQVTPQLVPVYFNARQTTAAQARASRLAAIAAVVPESGSKSVDVDARAGSSVRVSQDSPASPASSEEGSSPSTATSLSSDAPTSQQPASLIPTTGADSAISHQALLWLVLSLLFIGMLGAGGYRAFANRRG